MVQTGRRAELRGWLRLSVLAVTLVIALALQSATARAAPLPVCAPPGINSPSMQMLLTDGQSIQCQTQHYKCPPNAVYCVTKAFGEVGTEPTAIVGVPGAVAHDVEGTFEIQGLSSTGPTRVFGRDTCTMTSNFRTKAVCGRLVEVKSRSARELAGVCVATAHGLRSVFSTPPANAPTHIDIDFCRIQVTPYYAARRCRLNRTREQAASAARSSCRGAKPGRPLRPLPNPAAPPKRPDQPNNPCDTAANNSQPCFLRIEVNGTQPDPEETAYGLGIVTVAPGAGQPTLAETTVGGGFRAGTWAAAFNDEPGCVNGYTAVDECDQFEWDAPVAITLTAHPVPTGGYGTDSPAYSSKFVSWGGDCAGAGTAPTCTLLIGSQRGAQGYYNLDVVAYFKAAD